MSLISPRTSRSGWRVCRGSWGGAAGPYAISVPAQHRVGTDSRIRYRSTGYSVNISVPDIALQPIAAYPMSVPDIAQHARVSAPDTA
eukprot:2896411-Rhodomonas_salina.2